MELDSRRLHQKNQLPVVRQAWEGRDPGSRLLRRSRAVRAECDDPVQVIEKDFEPLAHLMHPICIG